MELGAKKMIDIGQQTIIAWYKDMLREGWTKDTFLKRVSALKTAAVYNRIDWSDWIGANTETFGAFEVDLIVNKKIAHIIQQGQLLKNLSEKDFVLTPDELKYVELAAAKEVEAELQANRLNFIDSIKDKLKAELRAKNKVKRHTIAELTSKQKNTLVEKCFQAEIFKESERNIFKAIVENLPLYADIIPDEMI